MSQDRALRGMTWGHSRALTPLLAHAAARHDNGAGKIEWDVRSLWEFGEGALEDVLRTYDVVVVDHPFIGTAVHHGLLVRLEDHVEGAVITEHRDACISTSQASYELGGATWALALDAATQVAAYRPDLLDQAPPRTFDEVFDVGGPVLTPLSPIDALMTWCSLVATIDRVPFADGRLDVDDAVAFEALAVLTGLIELGGREQLELNPIQVYRRMGHGDEIAYSPFIYGYSNYSRTGFVPRLVSAAASPGAGETLAVTALGGAGLAVSAFSPVRDEAVALAVELTSRSVQDGLYVECGGQPARRSAWREAAGRAVGAAFFQNALEPTERAWQRPNARGFAAAQHAGARRLHQFLSEGGSKVRLLGLLREAFDATSPPDEP